MIEAMLYFLADKNEQVEKAAVSASSPSTTAKSGFPVGVSFHSIETAFLMRMGPAPLVERRRTLMKRLRHCELRRRSYDTVALLN